MNALAAVIIPIAVFLLQAWVAVEAGTKITAIMYGSFLSAYLSTAFIAISILKLRYTPATWDHRFDGALKYFLAAKLIIILYFFLIFIDYVLQNGYTNIRQFMTGDDIKTSPFYASPFMYIDAYILYPLNYIVLIALYIGRRWRSFILLTILIFIQFVVFYASRTIIYNFIMLALFGALHHRQSLPKALTLLGGLAAAGLALSIFIIFNRDEHLSFDGTASVVDSMIFGILNYHLVPPLLIGSLIETSEVFRFGAGYGLATFGFLLDPIISLLPVDDPKALMASKYLSAEAQTFLLNVDDVNYNAFATFLYPAAYDFGVAGPIIYGAFFGLAVGYAYKRRDSVGFVLFSIFAYFVYFNSFTFFITGDWFWVILFVAMCYRKNHGHKPNVHQQRLLCRAVLNQS